MADQGITGRGGHVMLENVAFFGFGTGIGGKVDSLRMKNTIFANVGQPLEVEADEVVAENTLIANDPKVGRRRRNARTRSFAPLPAFCSRCKSIFPSANYSIKAVTAKLWRNTETCPVCGNPNAQLSEGVFNLTRDVVQVISAPDFTYDMLARLAEILGDVQAGRISFAEAAPRVAEVSPGFLAAVQRVMSHPSSGGWATVIIGLLGLLLSYWAAVKTPSPALPGPPVTFSKHDAFVATLAALPKLPGPAVVNPEQRRQGEQPAQPAGKEPAPEVQGGHINKNTRAIVRALRRARLRQHRLTFGGARYGGPSCWCGRQNDS